MRFYTQQKKGFTLAEVLVAVSIIVILAAIAYPQFQESRKKGRDTQRVSDINNIRLALRLYKDSNDTYPVGYDSGVTIGEGGALDGIFTSLSKTPADPSGSLFDSIYEYVYDSSFTCGGTAKKVVFAKTPERPSSGNWGTVCGTLGEDGTSSSTYGVILQ